MITVRLTRRGAAAPSAGGEVPTDGEEGAVEGRGSERGGVDADGPQAAGERSAKAQKSATTAFGCLMATWSVRADWGRCHADVWRRRRDEIIRPGLLRP